MTSRARSGPTCRPATNAAKRPNKDYDDRRRREADNEIAARESAAEKPTSDAVNGEIRQGGNDRSATRSAWTAC